jgi:methylenetetrahydrofolate dehydrogenase (NADP+)/methenyltetrahydrofolate cyclohydrolase
MQKIDGRALARTILQNLQKKIQAEHLQQGLAIVLVGNNQASETYVRLKETAAEKIGIHATVHRFSETATEAEVIEKVQALNVDAHVHGIIVQLPLPRHMDPDRVIGAIDPAKDADGFHPVNIAKFRAGKAGALAPGLCEGIWQLALTCGKNLTGVKAVVIANSPIFAEPMALLLTRDGTDTTICYPPFHNFTETTRLADVIVIATGKAGFLKAEHVKPDAIIIDVGFNRVNDKTVGDVDAESMTKLPGWLTPVPGGVGPVTVAMLLERTTQRWIMKLL